MLFSAGQVFLFWSQRKAHIQSRKICPGLRANHQQTRIKDQVVLDVDLEWAPFPAYITSPDTLRPCTEQRETCENALNEFLQGIFK